MPRGFAQNFFSLIIICFSLGEIILTADHVIVLRKFLAINIMYLVQYMVTMVTSADVCKEFTL